MPSSYTHSVRRAVPTHQKADARQTQGSSTPAARIDEGTRFTTPRGEAYSDRVPPGLHSRGRIMEPI